MGKSLYDKCVDMVKDHRGEVFTEKEVRLGIITKIGGDKRTINQAFKIMLEAQLIKDLSNARFQIL